MDIFVELMEALKADESTFQSRLGQCYVLSGRYIFNHPDEGLLLVHGTINGRRWTGKDLNNPHAWIEDGEEVFDPVLDKKMPKEMYYELMNAVPDHKYTFKQVCKITAKNKHWGPWE